MDSETSTYGIAIPDIEAFRVQVAKLSSWVVAALGIHWLFVQQDGTLHIVGPSGPCNSIQRTRASSAMSFVAQLMKMAEADTDVLRSLDSNGDDFSEFRDVDFLLIAPSKEKVDIICGFVNDHGYGSASAYEHEGSFDVKVMMNMPVQQPIILSVSGFMACVAHLFGAELDGWDCPIQKRT